MSGDDQKLAKGKKRRSVIKKKNSNMNADKESKISSNNELSDMMFEEIDDATTEQKLLYSSMD